MKRLQKLQSVHAPAVILFHRFIVSSLVLAVFLSGAPGVAAPRVTIQMSSPSEAVNISWVSESVTHSPPFWHNTWQVQVSGNLMDWENAGEPIPGGVMTEKSKVLGVPVTLASGKNAEFIRVLFWLSAAGSDLSGSDFSGSDLRGADFAGADLSGSNLTSANLAQADLSGANLAGVSFAGAHLSGVQLNGSILTGLDFSGTQGTPFLNLLTVGDPEIPAADALPKIPYRPGPEDIVLGSVESIGLPVASRDVVLMLNKEASTRQLNELMAEYGGTLVGAVPSDQIVTRGMMVIRLPVDDISALFEMAELLDGESIIDVAVPDIYLSETLIHDDTHSHSEWKWTSAVSSPQGGNWGLEYGHVPQLWNLNPALIKKGATPTVISILDSDLSLHRDVPFTWINAPLTSSYSQAHGIHVSGIIGAKPGAGGIHGINPFSDLGYYSRSNASALIELWDHFNLPNSASSYAFLYDLRELLSLRPKTRIVNISSGYNWWLNNAVDAKNNIGPNPPFDSKTLEKIRGLCQKYGTMLGEIARSHSNVLIVCAAGNDHRIVPAELASPMTFAALHDGVENILVVEAHDDTGARADFSNQGGHVAAPGVSILSTLAGDQFGWMSGTSQATPFVTGVAGYLLAINPDLKPTDLIRLIVDGARLGPNQMNVNAFASALLMDEDTDREILRMLLDVDDGTPDGSLRIDPRIPVVGWDRTFTPADGEPHTADAMGDGSIDMADFRRWRDWLYIGEELGEGGVTPLPNAIDDPFSLKLDTNGDGIVAHGFETMFFPRGDFNGDGQQDRLSRADVPGVFMDESLTDLEVLISSKIWDDSEVKDPKVLASLTDSADLWVSAANFFSVNLDLGVSSAGIGVYPALSRTPLIVPGGGGWVAFKPLGTQSPHFEFTVPVGQTYFISSEPIDIPGTEGEQVLLRSISEQRLDSHRRGADLVVDLTCLQMTGKAKAEQASDSRVHVDNTDVLLNEVKATVPATGGFSEESGSRAEASEDGSTLVRADAGWVEGFDPNVPSNFTSEVVWWRSFIKNPAFASPKFHIYPLKLVLGGTLPDGSDLHAEAEIIIEKRRGAGPWIEVVRISAAGSGNSIDGFTKDSETLHDPFSSLNPSPTPKTMTPEGTYTQDEFTGTFPIEDIPEDASFEVRYRLKALATGTGSDNFALAEIADPFEYGGGMSFGYGSHGALSVPQTVTNGTVTFFSRHQFYYVLERIENDGSHTPVDMMYGFDGPAAMTDASQPATATLATYFIRNIPLEMPQDMDADGIDDVFELLRAAFLDPLEPADAGRDQDGDNFTNLAEYQNGTDLEIPDNPSTPGSRFAGVLIPAEFGSLLRLADVNRDGHLDLLSVRGSEILTSLGNPDGSWQSALTSPLDVTFGATPTNWVLEDLTGDAIPDAVVADRGGRRLLCLKGLGEGRFGDESVIPLTGRPEVVVVADISGDATPEIMVGQHDFKWTTLVAQSDGSFQMVDSGIEMLSVPTSASLGHFDSDNLLDLAITFTNHRMRVFAGNGDGSFRAPGSEYVTGFSPQHLAAGDVTGDGVLDLVTVNFTISSNTRDLSFFLGRGDGSFEPEVRHNLAVRGRDVQIAEVTGDAYADVLIADNSLRGYTVLSGAEEGLGSELAIFAGSSDQVLLHDWNRDGSKDLISTVPDNLLINLADGHGAFHSRMDVDVSDRFNGRISSFAVTEMDGDNSSPEIVVLRNESSFQTTTSSLAVWDSPIATGGSRQPRFVVDVGSEAISVAVGDFNADGIMDYAVASGHNFFGNGLNELQVLVGGDGGSGVTGVSTYPLPSRPKAVMSGDFNQDNLVDLVVTLDSGEFMAFASIGDGSFAGGPLIPLGSSINSALLMDLNGNGGADICAAGQTQSGGTFLTVMSFDVAETWTELYSASSPADINFITFHETGSGSAELLAQSVDLLNAYSISDNAFGLVRSFSGLGGDSIAATDLNADGIPDFALSRGVHIAQHDGTIGKLEPFWLGANATAILAIDMNHDEKPDIVALTQTGVAVLPQQ